MTGFGHLMKALGTQVFNQVVRIRRHAASFAELALGLALIGITCIPSAIAGVFTDLVLTALGHTPDSSLLSNFFWPVVGLLLMPTAAKRSIPLPSELDASRD